MSDLLPEFQNDLFQSLISDQWLIQWRDQTLQFLTLPFCVTSFQLHSFACGYALVPELFVEKTILYPLNGFSTVVENQLTLDVWVFFLDS